jgi:hypothetical protein
MSIKVSATAGAAAAVEVEECMVCCEPYNKRNHTQVECEYGECKYKVCIECVRAYLMSSVNDAHCMQCNKAWSQSFQVKALKQSWINGAYRQHRKKLLLDIEISKLPQTMDAAARMKFIWSEQALLRELVKERDEIKHRYNTLVTGTTLLSEARRKINNEAKVELTPINQQIMECLRRLNDYQDPYAAAAAAAAGAGADGGADGAAGAGAAGGAAGGSKKEKQVFMMPCQANECKGMLSTQYKCGICELFACPDCHEIIGTTKTSEHTCDPNNVASAEAIKKETKQCPGCPNRIYRIEGCSQMWCTGCHTAFDWNTGQVVKSQQLHNPHWMEYQRAKNNGEAPMRAPGDLPCGGLIFQPDRRAIEIKVTATKTAILSSMVDSYTNDWITDVVYCSAVTAFLPQIYLLVDDIGRNVIRTMRETLQHELDFEHERCHYILNKLTKENFATVVLSKHTERAKTTQLLHVFELFSAVGIDVFNEIHHSALTGMNFVHLVLDKMIQLNAMRIHCNGLFAEISHSYNLSVPYFDISWMTRSQKRNQKQLKELLEEKVDHTIIGVVSMEWFNRITRHTGMYLNDQREKNLAKVIAEAANAAELAETAIKEADETAVKAIADAKEKARMATVYAEMMKTRAEKTQSASARASAPIVID